LLAAGGRRVYYGTLADLITSLQEAKAAGKFTHRLKTLGYFIAGGSRGQGLHVYPKL